MPDASPASATSLYGDLMVEVKERLQEIELRLHLFRLDPKKPSSIFEIEAAYLQTRLICELIAMASVVAHQPAGIGRDLLKAFSAGEIFSRLATINPHCFPVPVRIGGIYDGIMNFEPLPGRNMGRNDLKGVYDACGRALHVGIVKHVIRQEPKRHLEPGRVEFWHRELVRLLLSHVILIPHEHRVVLVQLNGNDGEILVSEAVADGPIAVAEDWPAAN